jgi:uncharacterized membrane protein
MPLIASVALIVIGLVLALIVSVDESTSDMRIYGWVLVAVGLLGVLARFMIFRVRRAQVRRGLPREPGPRR